MGINYNLFKSVAMRNGCNLAQTAKVMGFSAVTLRRKMTEREGVFTRRDVLALVNAWDITPDEVNKIFFCKQGQ